MEDDYLQRANLTVAGIIGIRIEVYSPGLG